MQQGTHRVNRPASPNHKRNVYILVTASALAVIVAACLVLIFSSSNPSSTAKASTRDDTQIQAVSQPATAAQVARSLNCTGFKDEGRNKNVLFTIGGGSCYVGGIKYGINIFPNKEARDNWLKSATQFGVVPKWETDTSVTYPSVT